MSAVTLDDVLARYRAGVEAILAQSVPSGGGSLGPLHDAMRYTLESGGKRIRPVVCLAACEAIGGADALVHAHAPAAALELIHTYSLIHDDLPCMDDDAVRRGKPSNHRAHGEALAVLAGDALLTRAFGVIAEAAALPAATRIEMVAVLAEAAGSLGMVGGQALDLAAERETEMDLPRLESIHTRKTGALFGAACRLGGLAAGGAAEAVERLGRLGEKLGLAFQVADDLLDELGRSEDLQKTSGRDRERGKATYPGILGVEESHRRVAQLTEAADALAGSFGSRGEPLRAVIRFVAARPR